MAQNDNFPSEPFALYNGGNLGVSNSLANSINATNWMQAVHFNAVDLLFTFPIYKSCTAIQFMLQSSPSAATGGAGSGQATAPGPFPAPITPTLQIPQTNFTPLFETDDFLVSPGASVFQGGLPARTAHVHYPRLHLIPIAGVYTNFGNGSVVGCTIRGLMNPWIRLANIVAVGASTDTLTISAEFKQLQG